MTELSKACIHALPPCVFDHLITCSIVQPVVASLLGFASKGCGQMTEEITQIAAARESKVASGDAELSGMTSLL